MMIFDRFPNRIKAEAFAKAVKEMNCHACGGKSTREAIICDSQKESNSIDIFPFKLDPPIVLVERYEDLSGEKEVRKLVSQFDGEFAGT
jgi:hypothetical protein